MPFIPDTKPTGFIPDEEQAPKKEGVLKSLTKDIVRPFARVGLSVARTGEALSKFATGDIKGFKKMDIEGEADLPFLGKIKPVKISNPLDTLGVGTEIGSSVIPIGKGAQIFKQGLKTLIKQGAKEGIKVGALSSAGRALQEEKPSVTKVVGETVGGAVGGAVIGGALPISGAVTKSGVKLLGKGIKSAQSIATGVGKDILERAFREPQKMQAALQHVAENAKEPFLNLARQVTDRMVTLRKEAKQVWRKASVLFHEESPDKTFDVSNKIYELKPVLQNFNLGLVQVRQNGKLTGEFEVTKKITSKFENKEIDSVQELVNVLRQAKKLTVDDILDVRQKFDAIYNRVRFGNNGEAKPFHALVLSLREKTDEWIEEILPQELKEANNLYRTIYQIDDYFGKRIADANGEISQTAEQFLANVGNMNKGEQRELMNNFISTLGIDIPSEAQFLKDAQKLSQLFPATGSRTQDILRSLFTAGTGFGLGGPIGAPVGIAASSPLLAGKTNILAGKISNRISKALDKIQLPQNIKNTLQNTLIKALTEELTEIQEKQ